MGVHARAFTESQPFTVNDRVAGRLNHFCVVSLRDAVERLIYHLHYYWEEMQRESLFLAESCQNFQKWLDQALDYFSAQLDCLEPGFAKTLWRECKPKIRAILTAMTKLRNGIRRHFAHANGDESEIRLVFRKYGPRAIRQCEGLIKVNARKIWQTYTELRQHHLNASPN